MSTVATTPIPLFENGGRPAPPNRLASLLGVLPPGLLAGTSPSTAWSGAPAHVPPQRGAAGFSYQELSALAVALFIRARVAEANNEISRPLCLQESAEGPALPDLRLGDWVCQMKGQLHRGAVEPEPGAEEEPRPQPEFTWSKSRYRARKAAQEFSRETHADH